MLSAAARWLTHHGWQATLVGILIGIICSIPPYIANDLLPITGYFFMPAPLCAILAVVCSIILSGALHEDGLADTADSLGTPQNKHKNKNNYLEKRLQVMHDPHCGSFAVLALIVSLITRMTALTYLFFSEDFFTPLLLTHAAARSAFPLWCRYLQPHEKTNLARLLDDTMPTTFSILSPFLLTAVLAFVLLTPTNAAIFLATLATCSLLLLLFFQRKFSRLSGDLCGFGEQILECILLLGLCFFASAP